VAANLHSSFSSGAYFVALAPINDPDLVLPTIAQTLGVRGDAGEPIMKALCAALAQKHLLLVLDNFEQVISAGPWVLELLQCAPRLHMVVTSRTVLRVYGEQEYQVLPLGLPDAAKKESPEELARYEAVRLFIERARAVKPGFTPTNGTATAIAEICRRLDGLPLAIELAAARIKLLSPKALLRRLDQRLPFLTRGATTLPYRHQTLRDAIAWSYDLLDEDEKNLFRRLAVFVGGCTLEAAEAVGVPAANDRRETTGGRIENSKVAQSSLLDAVAALVDKSLLRHVERGEEEEPRLTMLETVREYALEKLQEGEGSVGDGELDMMQKEHALYFMRLAEEAEPQLTGPRQQEWLEKLEGEHDNIRAALKWASSTINPGLHQPADGLGSASSSIVHRPSSIMSDRVEIGLRIGGAIWRFWDFSGRWSEGKEQIQKLSSLAASLSCCGAARAKALNGAGALAFRQADTATARSLLEDALALGKEMSDSLSISTSLNILANVFWSQGDQTTARSLYEQSLVLRREIGDKVGIAAILHNLGNVATYERDFATARALYEEGLELCRDLGDNWGVATSLNNLGNVAYMQGDFASARSVYEEGLALIRELGDKFITATYLNNLGNVAYMQGDYAAARSHHLESLAIKEAIDYKWGVAVSLAGLGEVAVESGEPRVGARLLGASDALHEALGVHMEADDRIAYDRALASARARLGEEAFTAAWEEGKALRMEEAIALALQPLTAGIDALPPAPRSDQPRKSPSALSELTAREIDVLRLVMVGLSNPEIAEHLSLSIFTVQAHLRSIFSKINVKTRAAAVHFAFEHSLN
jgi:predicted ATPase/DNA-binding CsgD family transcriptional regulator/Tfp pilus assembly protein PilF